MSWFEPSRWAFRAKKKMAFKAFQRKELVKVVPHKKSQKKYWEHVHQMNHMGGHPEDCRLGHLELCTAEENRFMYSIEAKELFCTVFKRPARKRPAAAPAVKKFTYKRPASSG